MSNKLILPHQSTNDRTPYWGAKTHPEFKYLSQLFNNKIDKISLSRACFRDLLKILVSILTTDDEKVNSSNENYFLFKKLSEQHNIPLNTITAIYSSLYKLFRLSIKTSSIKQEIMKEDLVEQLKFPPEFVNDFVGILYSQRRDVIEHSLVDKSPKGLRVKTMNWRVDVSISTSSLSRTLEPSIIIEFLLSNDQKVSFEMSLASFHLLRFNVAFVLKEMDDLLNRQMFKLID